MAVWYSSPHTTDETGEKEKTMPQAKRILKIEVKRMDDESPDTSYLGTYSNHADNEYAIDRAHTLDCPVNNEPLDNVEDHCQCETHNLGRNEYRYFNPATTDPHETPEQNRKDARFSYERMESLNDGNWSYIGIRAQAEILIDSVTQRITSGGLWGIESDSEPAYLKEIEDEELSSLRDILHNLGFSKRAIATAVKDIQHS